MSVRDWGAMGFVAERARRAAERERYASETAYLQLCSDPVAAAARFLRSEVHRRFVVSGADVDVHWLRPPPRGSMAQLVLEHDLGQRLFALIERDPHHPRRPRARFWVDAYPGAVEVFDLADLAMVWAPDSVAA